MHAPHPHLTPVAGRSPRHRRLAYPRRAPLDRACSWATGRGTWVALRCFALGAPTLSCACGFTGGAVSGMDARCGAVGAAVGGCTGGGGGAHAAGSSVMLLGRGVMDTRTAGVV